MDTLKGFLFLVTIFLPLLLLEAILRVIFWLPRKYLEWLRCDGSSKII